MFRLSAIVAVFLGCLLFPLAAFPAPSTGGAEPKKGLPEAALKILSGATRVECFRIDPRTADTGEGKPGAKHIDGYPITATAKEQGRDFADKLTAALKDEQSYGPAARCFFPGVGFRAWKDKESVDVVICYMCSNFYVVAHDADGKEVARTQLAGFQGNWAAFVQLAKAAFPDDPAIQQLDAKDSRGGDNAKSGL
jgi:hypothetical protein